MIAINPGLLWTDYILAVLLRGSSYRLILRHLYAEAALVKEVVAIKEGYLRS